MSRYPFPVPFGWYQLARAEELDGSTPLTVPAFGTTLRVARAADGPRVTEPWAPDDPWASVERNRGVWCWYHPHGEPPGWDVPELPPFHRPAGEGTIEAETRFSIGACLQEIHENGYDAAHLRYVHGTTADHELTFTDEGDHRALLHAVIRYDTARGTVTQEILNRSWGPGLGMVHFAGVVDTWFLATAVPVDVDRTEVRFTYRFRAVDGGPADPRATAAYLAEIERQYRQDQAIWEHKAYLARPALTDGEALIARFRRWYRRFYADAPADDRLVWPPPRPPHPAG